MTNEIQKLIYRLFIFSFLMIIIGLLMGVYSREILRPIEKSIDFERLALLQNYTLLGHGHFIFIGALIPMALAGASYILRDKIGDKRRKGLERATILIFIGAILTLALNVYKSSHFVFSLIADPAMEWGHINETLFGGSVMLRSISYTLAHPLLGVGLIWYIVHLWKATNEARRSV